MECSQNAIEIAPEVQKTSSMWTNPLYGSELLVYPKPHPQKIQLAAECARWVVGARRGSSRQRVSEISGIRELEELMRRKRIRWEASVYTRRVVELVSQAENILKDILEPEAQLRWLPDTLRGNRQAVKVAESKYMSLDGTGM